MFVRAGEKEQDIYRIVREMRKKRKKNTQTMRSVDGKGPKTKSEAMKGNVKSALINIGDPNT